MKKVSLICFAILCNIAIVLNVHADMGAPSITKYEVRVKNIEGTSLVKYDKTTKKVPYDTILTINYEYKENDILYGDVIFEDDVYTINLADTEILQKDGWEPKEFVGEQTKYVYKEGAYLYKGPSKIYGKVDQEVMIPVGTTIKIFEVEQDEVWGYVTYEGTSGWIYYYRYDEYSPYDEATSVIDIVKSPNEISFLTATEIKISESPQSEEILFTIKENIETSAEFKYIYSPHPYLFYYYISWNGKEGWMKYERNGELGYKINNGNIYTLKEVEMFQNDLNTKINQTIPKYTELNILYITQRDRRTWYYVFYNGKEGYIIDFDLESMLISENSNIYSLEDSNKINPLKKAQLEQDAEIYDNIYGNKTNQIISAGENVQIKYRQEIYKENKSWYYVITDTTAAWIYDKQLKYIENPKEEKEEEIIEQPKTNAPQKSFKEMVIYCIVAAIILALVAFVTIRLINKKRAK